MEIGILCLFTMEEKDTESTDHFGDTSQDRDMMLKPHKLPRPEIDPKKPLLKALRSRRTTREIKRRKLPLRILSALLWAAWGINRPKGPFGMAGRTAASASNSQEIDLYIVLEEGIYLYEPLHHSLVPVRAGDFRPLAIGPGQAEFAGAAPVHLVYVADIRKLTHTSGFQEPGLQDPEIQKSYYFVDTGLIAGNVYLFAAAHGLASWFHNCNKPALAQKMQLRPDQRVLFGQTIGYPEKKKPPQ